MPGGVAEIHRDDSPFATGTHKGADGAAVLYDPGADFKSCGVQTEVLIKNTTDESTSETTAVTEDTVTGVLTGGSNNSWANGDTYEIYITDTEDSIISRIWVDRRYGRKSDKEKLYKGLRSEDMDIDEFTDHHVWGPGQPQKSRT